MVHIIDDWYLDSDENGKGLTIKRDSGRLDKDNNKVFMEHFYPSSIDKGIERLCRIYQNKLTTEKEIELSEYLGLCKEITNDFVSVIEKLNEGIKLNERSN